MSQNFEETSKQIEKLIENIQSELQNELSKVEKLDSYKKQLFLLEKRITEFKQKGEEFRDELRSQKIKLVLKIDQIENAITCAKALLQIGKTLTETYNSYNLNPDKKPKNLKLINEFNGVQENHRSPSQAYRFLKKQVKNMHLVELAKTINEICNLNNANKMFVFRDRMISRNDMDFHEDFFKNLNANLKEVLNFNKTKKTRFTPSEMLKFYVKYTLSRDSEI